MSNLEEVYSEWQNNLDFRTAFQTNPEEALAKAGFTLASQDLKKIQALVNQKILNENLNERISK